MAGRSLDDTPTKGNKAKWSDFVEKFNFKKDDWHVVRFFGPVWTEFRHSVRTKTDKFYPEYCHGWNVDTGEFFPDKEDRCPICALLSGENPPGKDRIQGSYRYIMNLIDIEIEENRPANPKPGWTCVRLADLPVTAFTKLKDLKAVNKNYSIDHPEMGAILQIKHNPDTDPAKQYNVTMDTKNIAFTDAQKTYTVCQKYPDGGSKILKGKDGLPGYFEYVRCVNSRDDMIRSLKTHGYFGEQDEAAPTSRRNASSSYEREERVARVEAEAPIETMDDFIPLDEEPTPKKVQHVEAPSNIPYDDCPSAFGEFASAVECFTKCGVMAKCREATEAASKDEKPPVKKAQAYVPDDDDTV